MLLAARNALLAMSAVSAVAMLYVGAYQVRAVEHLRCPLLEHGCEAVADAPFARPFGIPAGFIAAGMYGLLIVLAIFNPQTKLLLSIDLQLPSSDLRGLVASGLGPSSSPSTTCIPSIVLKAGSTS